MAFDLKDEKEVKQYLDNLGIEYRFGCFSEKNPEACHLLADYLEAVKKDFEKSAKVYKNNCDDLNYAKSCYKFGNYSLMGKGSDKENPEQAYKYFTKGCDLNDADACLHAGLMTLSNDKFNHVGYNLEKALKNITKSCEGNNANACHYLSGMYISGVRKGGIKTQAHMSATENPKTLEYDLTKDMEKAFKYATKACELNNVYACANLSQMYARGEGTKKNPELADKFKKIALEIQDELMNNKQSLTFQEGLK